MKTGKDKPTKLDETWSALADAVVADMRRDGLDWIRSWQFEPPRNAVTGKPYRGRNAILLLYAMRVAGFKDPRFVTYNMAKEAGWQVAKGSKSFPIEKWRRFAFRTDAPDERIRQPRTEEEWRRVLDDPDYDVRYAVVGHFNVFNASQVEGVPELEARAAREIDDDLIDQLEEFSPAPVDEVFGNEAYYNPGRHHIVVPTRPQFASSDAMARVLLHEQTHSTGHESILGRDLTGSFGSEKYAREELVAELGSLFCATELGIRFDSIGESVGGEYWDTHVSYLKGWSSKFEDPAAAIKAAVPLASAAAETILGPHRALAASLSEAPAQGELDAARPEAVARAARLAASRSAASDPAPLDHAKKGASL